ncbi:MAG: hypothetical protein AMK73_04165 [Planctomycetes bacterium SM23_32]|nr:MAG: hypothetical protein AMK73_04165 [Planctomycetes bacterium SM23_32]
MASEIRTEVKGRHHYRELVVEGESVGELVVWDLEMWLLGERLRVGGVGGVHTDERHRNKGYMRRLMEDTVEYMTGLGQHFSMLFGISDFYNKFGFAPCLPEHRIDVATRDAERAAAEARPCTVGPLAEEDHPLVVDLYNQDNRCRPAAIVRSVEHFRGFRKGSGWHTRAVASVLRDDAGKPLSYMVCDDSRTTVNAIEVNTCDPSHFATLLCELAKMAVERRCGSIELHMADDHPFARFVRRFGCRRCTDFPRMGSGMMRLLNQQSAFERLQPALERRLAETALRGRSVELDIETELGQTGLRLGGGSAGQPALRGSVRLGQDKLTQLLVGYRTAEEVLADASVEAEGQASEALDALFGGGRPYVWHADRF